MSFRKVIVGALVISAVVSSFADVYPDIPWKIEGAITREAISSEASRNGFSELAMCSWDVEESTTGDVYRYPFKAIVITTR